MALADKPAIAVQRAAGDGASSRSTARRACAQGPGDPGTVLEAFKPGTAPPDTYSIIGYTDTMGRPLTVAPSPTAR